MHSSCTQCAALFVINNKKKKETGPKLSENEMKTVRNMHLSHGTASHKLHARACFVGRSGVPSCDCLRLAPSGSMLAYRFRNTRCLVA